MMCYHLNLTCNEVHVQNPSTWTICVYTNISLLFKFLSYLTLQFFFLVISLGGLFCDLNGIFNCTSAANVFNRALLHALFL